MHNKLRLLAQTKSSLVAPLILISSYTFSDLVDLDPSPDHKIRLPYLRCSKSKVILISLVCSHTEHLFCVSTNQTYMLIYIFESTSTPFY